KSGLKLKNSKVLVVGVTYKKDVLDLRKSPALDIIEGLTQKNTAISYYDPLIPYLRINHLRLDSIKLTPRAIKRFDCVLIVTDHSSIDYALVLKNARLIFDTRNVYKGIVNEKIYRL
ncbi:MAG: UDP-N-acetyl-D-glucosamine dehydrogenase, partial [Candidatus Omnitrophica bacterium]|nr:UDP-N-acetyl-D-glucosamine dehydrogenase [Candidatus Omnitrophota bacterium]